MSKSTLSLSQDSRFASISLHKSDTLRFLRFPVELIPVYRQTIAEAWPLGIQSECPYAGSHEIKLVGTPWRGGIDARRIISALLETLHAHGWVLTLNTNVNNGKDTLIFRHRDPQPEDLDYEWATVAFVSRDTIQFVDFPGEMRNVAVSKIRSEWVREISDHGPEIQDVSLNETIWAAKGTTTMIAREVLLCLAEALQEEGWLVYASVAQENHDERNNTDMWHCRRVVGWNKGMPVHCR